MLLKSLVCAASLWLGSASRKDFHLSLNPYYGVPKLDVFYTNDAEEAASFLEEWSDQQEFGLYIRVVPSDNKAFFPVRVETLGICRGTRVLIFDLKPYLREVPSPLPAPVAKFLEAEDRTFYGMDLKRSGGRLAFEFDTVIRCVDFNIRAWPEMRRGGGLYGIFNRFVSLDIDLWRPEALTSVSAQARHTYLQWSVAHYFLMFYGSPAEEWLITMSELFEAGPVYLRVADPQHTWVKAREEWMQRKKARAARSILRSLEQWRAGAAAARGEAIGEDLVGEAAEEAEAKPGEAAVPEAEAASGSAPVGA